MHFAYIHTIPANDIKAFYYKKGRPKWALVNNMRYHFVGSDDRNDIKPLVISSNLGKYFIDIKCLMAKTCLETC